MVGTKRFLWILFYFSLAFLASCQYDLDELNELTLESDAAVPAPAETDPLSTETATNPPSDEAASTEKKEEVTPTSAEVPPAASPAPQDSSGTKPLAPPMLNVPTFGYIPIPSNTPPLFSPNCLSSPDPAACSRKLLQEWLSEALKNQINELKPGEHSTQFISFVINESGYVEQVTHYGSKGSTFCRSCINNALEMVTQMPRWLPARQNGKNVRVSLRLPIRFEVI